ncbi:MAG: hypothetical protein QOF84_2752 [Streptomyces sp.]|jgi:hypothetical protein|nr:hypothetical protein [Streptomyces sp.]
MSAPTQARPATATAAPRARRFWSARRIPAALTALVVLGAAGLLLYDVAAVRAHRPGMAWRRTLAHELANRPLNDVWVVTGAAVAAALGLWLLLLAATPGLRTVLPMRRDTTPIRAGLDRHAAELALRDKAMEVPGVRSARVSVGRRRAWVRAEVNYRDTDLVRADLDAALADGLARLSLARPPALALSVRRAAGG